MSIEEIEAVLLDLPTEQLDELLERVITQRVSVEDEIDPAVLAEAQQRSEDMTTGRVKPVPFEQLINHVEPPTVHALEVAAMQIPAEDRAELVDRLISGLTGTDGADPEWLAELNRRIDEVDAGTAKTVPAEEVFARMRARRNARSLS